MVASPSAQVYSPEARPQLVVASDGMLAAVQEPSRVVVVEVPSCAPFAELGTDSDAAGIDVAWVGSPPRLLVLSRYSGHSTIHLVDPFGPRTIAELRLEASMNLMATVGSHALAVGSLGSVVLTATDSALAHHTFPARANPVTAGAAGTQFLVGLAGAIEEWDPQSRMPKRRLKLPRPAMITAVGGSERAVWLTTKQDPRRIDVLPLVNRGQPKFHDLPEPIAAVAAHPRSDLLVCLGAQSGRVWVIDLDGRAGLRMIGPEGIARVEAIGLVLGRVAGVLAAQTDHPLTVVALERSEPAAPSPREAAPPRLERAHQHSDEVGEVPTAVTLTSPPLEEVPSPRPATSPVTSPRQPATRWDKRVEAGGPPQLAAFRERVANERARTSEPPPAIWPDALPMWREDVVTWAQQALGGETEIEAPASTPFGTLVTRFELAPQLQPVIALLYGLHLMGVQGAAPAEIARMLGSWDEALGRGELAARGVAHNRDSRVQLATTVLRVLDELPPLTGTIVGAPGVVSLLGPCTIVSTSPLPIVAEACAPAIGGAILAAFPTADPVELVREARAYGAAPMLRVAATTLERVPTTDPIILVVETDAIADQLGVPRLS